MNSLLCDVDGVVADLVGGLRKWINHQHDLDFEPTNIIYHHGMGRGSAMENIDETLRYWYPEGFGGAFTCFMRDPDVYMRWVDPVPGAVDAIAGIRKTHKVVFVTALMKSARDHFRSKMEWIERWFPGLPIITCPTEEKHMVKGTYAVDDRYETCSRWLASGNVEKVFLFDQSWNEIPDDASEWAGVTWEDILEAI